MEPAKKRIRLTPQEFPIMDLPNEILEIIFMKLPMQYIQQNIALVCKRFQEITRTENFVKSIGIELISKEEWGLRDQVDDRVLARVKKVLEIYPKCGIELTYKIPYKRSEWIWGYRWMSAFKPFATSITKMSLQIQHHEWTDGCVYFEHFIYLENLESLDFDTSRADKEFVCLPNAEDEFWDNFPKLKSLRLNMGLKNWMHCVSLKSTDTSLFFLNCTIYVGLFDFAEHHHFL